MTQLEVKLGMLDSQDSAPEIETVGDLTANINEVQEMAKQSLDFLAAMAMPLVFRYIYPPLFKAAWAWLVSYVHKERDFSQLALGLPRGFAKTTFIKLFVLYCILFTKRTFILVCANTQAKANAIVADVVDFLEERNIKQVFGDWKLGEESDRQDLKKFGFRGRNIVISAGTVQTVRGLNLKHQRPDIMIFDDIQSKLDAESEIVSKQIESEMYGTAMKAKSPHGCLFIFIGNMYATKWSILRKIKQNPNWLKFIVGGILEDGTSLWEELQPIKQLIREYENDLAAGQPQIFFAEVLNDENASVNNFVDLTKIPPYDIPEDEIHQGNFVIIDPATDKTNADAVTVMYFEIHNTKPVCKDLVSERLSPGDTIRAALRFCLTHNCRLVAIESNAYQSTLCYWFNFICTQMQIIGIEAVEIYSGTRSKPTRILSMFKSLLAGETIIHPKVRPVCHAQITTYNPAKTDNVDGILDCLYYPHKVIELYGNLIIGGTIIEEQKHAAIEIPNVLESACF